MTFWTVVLAVVVGHFIYGLTIGYLKDWSSKWLKDNDHMKDKKSFHERIEEKRQEASRKKDNVL